VVRDFTQAQRVVSIFSQDMCKSADLAWNVVFTVIGADAQRSPDGLREQFNELSVLSAQKLIHFWVGRQKVFRNFQQLLAPK
jgi:hypothetical protein